MRKGQLERIQHMERCLDEATIAVKALKAAREQFDAAQPALQALSEYYGSDLWKQDYADDEAGRLPSTLKRGVLSQDAIWNLLEEVKNL